MLAKKNRLVKQKEIQAVFFSKFRYSDKLVKIFLRKNKLENFRLLVVVPKKVNKSAVKRHFLSRRIHYIFQILKVQNSLPKNLDCIILILDRSIFKQTFQEIKKYLLDKITIIYERLLRSN